MTTKTNSCAKHRQPSNRAPLDPIMAKLPRSQAGKEGEGGRHKCAYCAYERGFEAGIKHAAASLQSIILKESYPHDS